MRWLKRLGLVVGVLCALLAVSGFAVYLTDPVYWSRVAGALGSHEWEVEWYEPLVEVPAPLRDDVPVAPPDTIDPEALRAAQAYADEIGSVALLVWHRGALRYEHYGAGFGPHTRTDTASLHKSVVGLLTGAAIADGLIESVDQPAADFLPEWRDEARRAIRIRDLLQMTSGLQLVSGFNPFARSTIRMTLTADLAPWVLSLPAAEPAGTRFEYANANPQLLSIVLARAAGKPYVQYLSERLWSHLGAGPALVQLDREGGTPRTFCCLIATARSWLKIGLLVLQEGRLDEEQIVPAEWIRAMTHPSAVNPNYGYLVWLGSPAGTGRPYNSATSFEAKHSEPFVAPDVVFLDGFGGQRVYVVPSRELVIVRTGRASFGWDDARIPNAIMRGLK